jgi:hypothetical protein
MNDRTRAIEILKQAREVLLARLAERVVDGDEDILDDAGGLNYSGAIESLHDQLGQRLGNVTALLAHLQAADEVPASYDVPPAEMSGVGDVDAVFGVGLEGYTSESSPLAAKDVSLYGGHGERSCIERAPASESDWSASPDEVGAHDETGPTAEVNDRGTMNDLPAASETAEAKQVKPTTRESSANNDSRDCVVQEAVFQEPDFRSLDLFTGDIEGSLLNAESDRSDNSSGK